VEKTELIAVVILVFVDGLVKPHSPGSLREPAITYLFTHHWSTLPLSFGLLMGMSSMSRDSWSTTKFVKLHGAVIVFSQIFIETCDIHANTRRALISYSYLP